MAISDALRHHEGAERPWWSLRFVIAKPVGLWRSLVVALEIATAASRLAMTGRGIATPAARVRNDGGEWTQVRNDEADRHREARRAGDI